MWAPTFQILRNILRWLPSSGYQLLGSFYMEHEQPCTHTHTIYTFFFQVAESFGPAFCTESGSFFSIWQSCICSSWLGNSASRLGGSLAQENLARFKILKMPFVYQTFPFITTDCLWHYQIFVYAVLAEKKPHWLVLYMNVGFHLISLLCIGSELWNGRTIAICGVFSRIRGICIHLSRCRLGKGKFWNSFLPKAARFLFWAWKSSVNRLDNPKSQWNFRRLGSLLFHCFSLYSL